MTQPSAPVVTKKVTPEENPEWSYDECVKQYGRVVAKRMARAKEPTVTVFIQPNDEDIIWAEAHDGAYPDTVMMLDGTRYPVKVGEENTLPTSVWEAYRTTKKMTRVRVPGVFTRQMGEELPSPR
jgi:hypothetical protein